MHKKDVTFVLLLMAACLSVAFLVYVFIADSHAMHSPGKNAASREDVYNMCMDHAPDTSKANTHEEYEILYAEYLNYKDQCSKLLN